MPGFSGQGKVLIGARQSNGLPGILRWIGNASVFRVAQNEDTVERSESYTGNRLPNRRMTRSRGGEITIVFDEFSPENMAIALLGQNTLVAAAAAVTNYGFPTGAVVGDSLIMPAKNVTAVTVVDSTGSPKTLVAGTNYELDAFAGRIDILNLTSGAPYVQPFKANFTPGAHNVQGAFKLLSTELYIRMDGINTDDNSRVICDVFRNRLSPARQLDLINEDFNDFELAGSVLADLTRSAASAGGQFYSLTTP
ncbi:MAG: hypothetical protein Q8R98_04285 [Rubrivivax sp.]|nr:hypothetical protein [Rubrivivax sp.]MDP3611047.1 hypothetical protein [Rubrivivax sp.]